MSSHNGIAKNSACSPSHDHPDSMESLVLDSSNWTLSLVQAIGFWPISVIQKGHTKTFDPSRYCNKTILLSLFFIFMDIITIIVYRDLKADDYFSYSYYISFDLIWVIVWDAIVILCNTTIRVCGIAKLPSLYRLFQDIVSLFEFALYQGIVSHIEIKQKLKEINVWAKKWIIIATIFGSGHISSYLYLYIVGWEAKGRESFIESLLNIHIEVMLALHFASALFMSYIIQLITFGFEMVTKKSKCFPVAINKIDMDKFSPRPPSEEHQIKYTTGSLKHVLEVIKRVEDLVRNFNDLFAPGLLAEAILTLCQVIFSTYYLHVDPRIRENPFWAICFVTPVILYPVSFFSLCYFSNRLGRKCHEMLAALEEISLSVLSVEEDRRLQLVASRLQANPPGIHVWRIFSLKESIFCSVLNTLATYMIVLIQMREINKPSS